MWVEFSAVVKRRGLCAEVGYVLYRWRESRTQRLLWPNTAEISAQRGKVARAQSP